jgi:hypothetical protein
VLDPRSRRDGHGDLAGLVCAHAYLHDGNLVQRAVELAVAAAGRPVP